MIIFLTAYLPALLTAYLSATVTDASSLSGLLEAATQVVTWIITAMGSYLAFVTSNPVILMMFLILLAGTAIAFLLRIWHSA